VISDLGGGYRAVNLLKIIPIVIRNRIYDYVSSHRYKWFGKKEECSLPSEDQSERILD